MCVISFMIKLSHPNPFIQTCAKGECSDKTKIVHMKSRQSLRKSSGELLDHVDACQTNVFTSASCARYALFPYKQTWICHNVDYLDYDFTI